MRVRVTLEWREQGKPLQVLNHVVDDDDLEDLTDALEDEELDKKMEGVKDDIDKEDAVYFKLEIRRL